MPNKTLWNMGGGHQSQATVLSKCVSYNVREEKYVHDLISFIYIFIICTKARSPSLAPDYVCHNLRCAS